MAKVEMKSLKILVVDDEDFMRRLISRLLNDLEVPDVSTAENGAEALDKLRDTRKKFDLVICDLDMPKMNGLDFVRELRKSPNTPNPHIPVLILTGHSHEDNIHGAIGLGVHGFLTKPVSRELLEKRISHAVTSPPIDPKMLDNR